MLVDRHYHYKEFKRWAAQLIERGVTQHFDLRADELGFTEYDGMRWAAGVAHCPGAPDELGDLARPPLNASPAEMKRFAKQIATREAMSMSLHTPPNDTGQQRVKCPALSGKVGCALRANTKEVAVELGLPVIENPPDITTHPELPACCTQQTVSTTHLTHSQAPTTPLLGRRYQEPQLRASRLC